MRLGNFYRISPDKWHFANSTTSARDAVKRYLNQRNSLRDAERHIEEFVRQWVLAQLLNQYNYPQFWLGEQLTVEEPVWIGSIRCRADIALKNRRGDPIIYVETKTYGVSASEFRSAEQQLKSYLSATYTVILGMVTDGVQTSIIHKRLDRNVFERIADLPSIDEAMHQNIFSKEDIEPKTVAAPNIMIAPEVIPDKEDSPSANPRLPTIAEYKSAFLSLSPYITNNQRALLQAHYNSPQRTATMTELAHAVGYASFRAANLQYGKLATLFCELLAWHYGVKINILVSFIRPQRSNGNQWQLIMLPEVAQVLKDMQWV